MRRVAHPAGGSTLITSAPISAKSLPHSAPFSSVRSSITKPLSSSHVIAIRLAYGLVTVLPLLGTGRPDRGGVSRVLRNDEAAAEHRLHGWETAGKLDGAGQLAGQHDLLV